MLSRRMILNLGWIPGGTEAPGSNRRCPAWESVRDCKQDTGCPRTCAVILYRVPPDALVCPDVVPLKLPLGSGSNQRARLETQASTSRRASGLPRVIPRSRAAQMVWIERSSSVPPHIQPPIAQVPSPIREGERVVPGIFTYSMDRLLRSR